MTNRARVAILPDIRPPESRPFVIEEREIPALEPGAILGRMVMAGVCGTDVHILHGKVAIKTPAILGHENVCRVEDIGGDAPLHDITGREIRIGDMITWLPKSCYQCYNCTILKDPSKCTSRIGYGGWVDATQHPYLVGGFAEYVWLLPGSDIVVIPEDINPAAVVLGDALRVMVHALEQMGHVHYGDSIVIQGSGAVGLMGLLLAVDSGVSQVIVVGGPASRLALASELGANTVIDIFATQAPDRIAQVRELTDGRGADAVIEATGVPSAVVEGLEMVRVDGRYCIAGHYGDAGPAPINPHLINRQQIHISGAWSADNAHFLRGLTLLRKLSGTTLAKLAQPRFGLDEINDALICAETQETVKVLVTP